MRSAPLHLLDVRRLLCDLMKAPPLLLHFVVPLELVVLKVRVVMVLTLFLWLFTIADSIPAALKQPKSLGWLWFFSAGFIWPTVAAWCSTITACGELRTFPTISRRNIWSNLSIRTHYIIVNECAKVVNIFYLHLFFGDLLFIGH